MINKLPIQASELRIGNYVNPCYWSHGDGMGILTPSGNYMKVYGILFRDSQMCPYALLLDGERSKMGKSLNEIEPIPLTVEIMEKAGFVSKYKSVGYVFNNRGFEFYNQDVDDYGGEIKDYIFNITPSCYPFNSIYYVHQLQNLYYSLTGQELEIKLS